MSSTLVKSQYKTEDRERALAACALANGSSRRASEMLAEQGHHIPYSTIQKWKTRDAERYHEIRTQVVDRIRQEQAEEHVELGRLAMDGERKALDLLLPKLTEMDGRDLSNAHRNLSVAAGIHAQRSGDLRGDASIIEHRTTSSDPTELEAQLKRLGVRVEAEAVEAEVIDGDAVEVGDVSRPAQADTS